MNKNNLSPTKPKTFSDTLKPNNQILAMTKTINHKLLSAIGVVKGVILLGIAPNKLKKSNAYFVWESITTHNAQINYVSGVMKLDTYHR